MTTKDIADLFVAAVGKIEFYWNFYTVTVLALIGWLASSDATLTLPLKLLITVGYAVFVLMNIIGLQGSYLFAEALQKDLLDAIQADPDMLNSTQAALSKKSFKGQRKSVPVIHAVLGVVILCSIWFGF